MRLALTTLCLTVGLCGAGSAQEAISGGPRAAPPAAAPAAPLTPKEDEAARWAQNILDRARAGETGKAAPPSCEQDEAAKPYREVRVAVGTGGYREVGGTVIYPTAGCGMVAVDVNLSEGGQGSRRRR